MVFIVKCAPVLKEWRFCCCSCNLRAAAIVLAWLGIVTNISQFVTCVIYLSRPSIDSSMSSIHPSMYSQSSYESREFLISMLGTVVGQMFLDVLLLYGIHSKKPMYMLPYLVLNLIGIVVLIAIIVILTAIMIIGISTTVNYNWTIGLTFLVLGSAFVALASFFWVVLYSYYREVEEEKNPNSGIVNYTYGIPNDQVQISCPEDQKALYPYPNKLGSEVA